jgi:tetratricopeptide (TPR) repeat protein
VRRDLAEAYQTIGVIYKNKEDVEKAIGYFERGLEISVSLGWSSKEASIAESLATAYEAIGSFAVASRNLDRALEIHKSKGNTEEYNDLFGVSERIRRKLPK